MTAPWQARPEAGTTLAIRIAIWIALHLGRRILGLVLTFVSAYFLLVRRAERRASRAFWQRVTGHRPSLGQVLNHFATFARVTADRVYFLSGRTDDIPFEISGLDIMERHIRANRGCVILGSHLGSFEATRFASLQHADSTVRMVLARKLNDKLIRQLETLSPGFAASLIDADQPPAKLGLTIGEALKRGESVGFLGDRYRPGDRTTTCTFLGEPARFPVGPLIIAAVFRAPIVAIFGIWVNGRYEVRCEELFDTFALARGGRDEALQQAMQRYVDRLEHYVRRAPDNWFNFYDFWQTD